MVGEADDDPRAAGRALLIMEVIDARDADVSSGRGVDARDSVRTSASPAASRCAVPFSNYSSAKLAVPRPGLRIADTWRRLAVQDVQPATVLIIGDARREFSTDSERQSFELYRDNEGYSGGCIEVQGYYG
jgi:hypothetical protein